MKVAYLDRDGTISYDYPKEKWPEINHLKLIPGSIEALLKLQEDGYALIIVTNQHIIGEGIITEDKYHQVHDELISKLKDHGINILKTFYCPHSKAENCNCLKPKPGMIEAALKLYPEIDLNKSLYFGDRMADLLLAEHFNLPIYFINKEKNDYSKCINVDSLLEGVNIALTKD